MPIAYSLAPALCIGNIRKYIFGSNPYIGTNLLRKKIMLYSLYSHGVNSSSHELGKFNAPSLADAALKFIKMLRSCGLKDEDFICDEDEESFGVELKCNFRDERVMKVFDKLAHIADLRGDAPTEYWIQDHNTKKGTISYVKTAWYAD